MHYNVFTICMYHFMLFYYYEINMLCIPCWCAGVILERIDRVIGTVSKPKVPIAATEKYMLILFRKYTDIHLVYRKDNKCNLIRLKQNADASQNTVKGCPSVIHRGGSKRISEWVRFKHIAYLFYIFGQTTLEQKCRPRSDAQNAASDQGLHGLPLIQQFYTFIGRKSTCWREVSGKVSQIYQIYPKCPMKMAF